MSSILDSFQRLFQPVKPLPPGTYSYTAPPDDPRNYRLHLRLEEDGGGVLIVNAATLLHLNRTAAEYAYYLVHGLPVDEAVKKIVSRYRVSQQDARRHYQEFIDRIESLVTVPDLDPVAYLDFGQQAPFSGRISAPYRLDCALTYSLPVEVTGVSPVERVARELTTTEWKFILDKAWQAGIPHVVFTGGEPTLRPDLIELITYAESLGQVSGLMTDGVRLAEDEYLRSLLLTGLDHLMLIYQPENPELEQALEKTLAADLFVAVHLTLTEANQEALTGWIDRLADQGVKAVSLTASHPALGGALKAARDHAAHRNLELVWNLPVPYSALNPVSLETSRQEELEGSGRAWLYVEPDGDVLPGQGINQVLGNLVTQPFEDVWQGV